MHGLDFWSKAFLGICFLRENSGVLRRFPEAMRGIRSVMRGFPNCMRENNNSSPFHQKMHELAFVQLEVF